MLSGYREALRRLGPKATSATRTFALVKLPELFAEDPGADFLEPIVRTWHRRHGHLGPDELPWASGCELVDRTSPIGQVSLGEIEVGSAGEMIAALRLEPIHPAAAQRIGGGTRGCEKGWHPVAPRPDVQVESAPFARSHVPLGYREPTYDDVVSAPDYPYRDSARGRRSSARGPCGTVIMEAVEADEVAR